MSRGSAHGRGGFGSLGAMAGGGIVFGRAMVVPDIHDDHGLLHVSDDDGVANDRSDDDDVMMRHQGNAFPAIAFIDKAVVLDPVGVGQMTAT